VLGGLGALVGMLAGAAGPEPAVATDPGRFDSHGITFRLPAGWHVTTRPLSNGLNPVYRFAVSTVPVRRTAADSGPCLPGVAGQLPASGALAYLREATGADRTASLPTMPRRPRTFRLPSRSDQGLCGFPSGGYWLPFKDGGRAFYLGVWVGPRAADGTRRTLRALLNGMRIAPR
jgi:hypothetical protein